MEKFAILDMEFTAWKGSLDRNWCYEWEKREIINISSIKFNNLNDKKPRELDLLCKTFKVNPLPIYFQKLTNIKTSNVNNNGIKTNTTFRSESSNTLKEVSPPGAVNQIRSLLDKYQPNLIIYFVYVLLTLLN